MYIEWTDGWPVPLPKLVRGRRSDEEERGYDWIQQNRGKRYLAAIDDAVVRGKIVEPFGDPVAGPWVVFAPEDGHHKLIRPQQLISEKESATPSYAERSRELENRELKRTLSKVEAMATMLQAHHMRAFKALLAVMGKENSIHTDDIVNVTGCTEEEASEFQHAFTRISHKITELQNHVR